MKASGISAEVLPAGMEKNLMTAEKILKDKDDFETKF